MSDDHAPLQEICHPACIVCRDRDDGGLGVRFDKQPGAEDLACERYRYVLSAYPETEAAAHSRARLASLCDERVEP